VSPNRVFVQASVHDRFVEKLGARIAALKGFERLAFGHGGRMIVRCDQHVVQVVVVVDHLRPQRPEAGQHVADEARHELAGKRAALFVDDRIELGCQPVRGGNVPQQVVRRARMRKAPQSAIQVGESGTHGPSLAGGAHGFADLDAVQIAQHPHAGVHTVGQRDRVVGASFQCPHHARHRQFGRCLGDVVERCDLKINDRSGLGGLLILKT
jgi:hypothetical protein